MYRRLPKAKWDETSKKWILSVTVDGVRRRFVSRKKSTGKKEVTERAAEWIQSQDKDGKPNLKFADVWNTYLADYTRKKGENEQLIQMRSIGRVFLLPALGSRTIGKLTIEDFQAVINEARPQKGTRPLSRKYLNNLKGVIVGFNRWAVVRDYMTRDLSGQLYVPASAKTVGRTILQISDIEELFKNRTGLWYERGLLLEVLTGLRPGEVLGLHRDDYIDGCLYVRRSINARGNITDGKNANASRVISLPEEVRKLVAEQLTQTIALKSVYMFPNKLGGEPSQVQFRRCWARICKAHGFPEQVTPYSLRHTFFTHTEAHLPDRLIKSVFGHSAKTDSHHLYGEHSIDGEAQEAERRLSVTPLYKAAQGE